MAAMPFGVLFKIRLCSLALIFLAAESSMTVNMRIPGRAVEKRCGSRDSRRQTLPVP